MPRRKGLNPQHPVEGAREKKRFEPLTSRRESEGEITLYQESNEILFQIE